ncbi:hypothetical protein [Flavobacterium alkalisoli]|uniref:hypothetical protein n=1 Tax=Flavobacterium alkalisoli TaxID=2602769 RepID=UPI003A91EFA9
MNSIDKITTEITNLTDIIKNTFPWMYENLSETPIFFSYEETKHIISDYSGYRDSLRSQFTEMVKIYELRKHENNVIQIKSIATTLIIKKQPLLGSNYASLI